MRRRIGMAKRRIAKVRHSITRQGDFVGNKEKCTELVRDICPHLPQRMLGGPLKNEEDTRGRWFYRRTLRISWTKRVSNDEILERMQARRKLIPNIRKRQLKPPGHVMRKEGLENLTLTGRVEGKRYKGKQHVTFQVEDRTGFGRSSKRTTHAESHKG